MQLNTSIDIASGRPCIFLVHGEETLSWNVKVFSNMNSKGGEPVDVTPIVKHINGYWALLSPQRQQVIFDLYKKAHTAIEEIADIKRLMSELRLIVRNLYVQHPWEEMDQYVRKLAKIKLPDDLKEVHGIGAPNTPQTYLKEEYIGLLVLVVQLRVMLPIWGAHVNKVVAEVGSDFKEYHVAKVLNMSRLVECPYYIRYKTYIETFIGERDEQLPLPVVLSYMGTEVIPEYMVAISMVRRLTCCDIIDWSMPGEPTHVISMVYNFIMNKSDQAAKTFAGGKVIKEKSPEGGNQNEDPDNTSRAEAFKIREPISTATLETYAVYMTDMANVIRTIAPEMPESTMVALVTDYSQHILEGNDYDPTDMQLVLVQWVLRSVIPPRSIPHLDYEATVRAVVVTCTLLSYWGYHDLALLLAGTPRLLPETTIAGNRRTNYTKEQVEALVRLYPHYQMPKLKRDQRHVMVDDTQAFKQNVSNNIAMKEIDELVKEYSGYEWKIIASLSSYQHRTMQRGTSHFSLPETIKNMLAELTIQLAEQYKLNFQKGS